MSRATQDTTRLHQASSTELSSSAVELSRTFLSPSACHSVVLLPRRRVKRRRFGLIPGRSPLLGESLLFSSPGGTKMFQFPPFASRASARDDSPSGCRVVPFGNPRVKGHLHLTAAYRSLSRPSSLAGAKASPVRPFLLSSTRGALSRRTADIKGGLVECHALSNVFSLTTLSFLCARFLSLFLCLCHPVKEPFRHRAPTAREKWRITDSNR